MKSKTVCVAFLALLIMPCYVQAGLLDNLLGGIGDTVGGLLGGIVDLLAAIPRGIANLLEGLLGSSKKGDLITLHSHLRILITKLPSEIKNGGEKVTLATIHTVLQLVDNLITSISKGKTQGVVEVLEDLTAIIEILQNNVKNAGTRAIFAKVYIQLSILLNNVQSASVSVSASQFTSILNSISLSLKAAIDGLQSNSATGGLTGESDLLQNIFFSFNLLQSQISSGQSSGIITISLKQLSLLLDGLELISTSQSTQSILHSLSINLDIMLNSNVVSFTTDDILSFITMTANSLNNVFNLNGISGVDKFVDTTVTSTQYLQQISIVLNRLKVSISSNDISTIQTLIFKLVKLLGQLQSVTTSAANLNTLSTLIINLHTVTQKISNNSISIGQITSLISNVLNTLNVNFDLGSVSSGGGGVISGSITVQLQNIFVLIKQLQSIISSGDTSGVSSLLQAILAQLQSFQGLAPSSVSNMIVTITTKITDLLQQTQSGSVDTSTISNVIQNITNTLNLIQITIGGGESGGGNIEGTVTGSVTVQLQHVFTLIQQLQKIASSGSTSGVGSLLQTILAQLQSLQGQAPSSISNLIVTITTKITNLLQQVQSGSINISSILNFVQSVTNILNEVQTSISGGSSGGGSTTTEISNIQALLQNFQNAVSSGNTNGISSLLDAFLQQLSKLQNDIKEADSRNVIIALIGNIYTLQQSLQTGGADSSSFQFFIKNIQDGLQKVVSIESSGGGGGGGGAIGGEGITNADISKVQSLLTSLQNILNSGTTQGASSVLQNLVTLLQGFSSKVSDSKAQQILNSIIQNITQLQQQATSGNVDMSSFANLVIQSVNNLNLFIQVLNSSSVSGNTQNNNGGWSWNIETSPTAEVSS